MHAYQQRWRGIAMVGSALGVGFSVLMWGPVTVTVAFAVLTCALAGTLLLATPGPTRVRRTLAFAAEVSAGLVALFALAVVSAGVALLAALCVAASSPPCVRRVRRAVAPEPAPPPQEAAPPRPRTRPEPLQEVPAPIECLSNAELCLAWRRSYTALTKAATTSERLEVVSLRQRYIEEMDRRNPRAMESWLASGARAASAPDRFLGQDPPQGRTAA